MRPRQLITIPLLASLLTLGLAPSAGADDFDDNANVFVSGKVDQNGATVAVEGEMLGQTVVGPGMPAWLRACTWQQWTLLDKEGHMAQFGSGGAPTAATLEQAGADPDQAWGVIFCSPGLEAQAVTPSLAITGVLATWPLADGLPRLVEDYLIARAYASIELPIQTGNSAPVGDLQAPLITQLPTWLWIEESIWRPVTATTPPVFGVTATVTATPTRVMFEGADDIVDCGANIGPPYDFNRDEEDQHSACTLTYHHTTAMGDWTLTSTIWWETTYTCSTGCGPGTLPAIIIRATRPVRVAELQAVLLPPRQP